MSFLTPLYLLGALAVGLPVVFHMIRRTPRGRREFSSVMFLEPSPPRITRRSRVEHWLLLLLRALAVCLLAAAFARPFLRVAEGEAVTEGETRDVVLLVDTSASMRRTGVWSEAVARVENLLNDVRPLDRVSLVTFDARPQVRSDFTQWTALDPAQRVAAAKTLLREITPSWGATNLGRALIEAAERLDSEASDTAVPRSRMIIVVSDLQEGSRLEELQAYQWPQQVRVRLEWVGADASPSNAGLHPVVRSPSSKEQRDEERVRVRVSNAADARREQFTLRWEDTFAAEGNRSEEEAEPREETPVPKAVTVIVPPGLNRVVSAPPRPTDPGSARLVLEGDDHDFDNRCDVPTPVQRTVSVAILSERANDDPQGLWYYLERALVSTPRRAVTVGPWGEFPTGEQGLPDLVVISQASSSEQADRLRSYLNEGGTVLFVPVEAESVSLLSELLEMVPIEAAEAEVETYSMLTDIDFAHPLFASLDHPRYSDFTKVRFWKHRRIDPAALPGVRVMARFDDGDMAIGEIAVGEGKLLVLTSGWHPDDSQLALSTKFVPMLNGLLDSAAGIVDRRKLYLIGDAVDLTAFADGNGPVIAVRTPAGDEVPVASDATTFTATDQPGRYRLVGGDARDDAQREFVVNLDPAESQTSPLPLPTLEAANVHLASKGESVSATTNGERQLRGQELENRQKLWRWLIVGAMIVLLGETLLAGRTARARTAESA